MAIVDGAAAHSGGIDELARVEAELDQARDRDDNEARVRLVPRLIELGGAEEDLATHWDELAYAHEQLGHFDQAAEALRRAIDAGFDNRIEDHPSAEALIADLLLRAGRMEEAERAWEEAERKHPSDPELGWVAGNAYAEVGLHEQALRWQTRGLELAVEEDGELSELSWSLTDDRAESLARLGRRPDGLQLRASRRIARFERAEQRRDTAAKRWLRSGPKSRQAQLAVAWFPADQYERALEIWPRFADDYERGSYASYCARLELMMRDLRAEGATRLAPTPIEIDDYIRWCGAQGLDPEDSNSRAGYAGDRTGEDLAPLWPPGRNQPCWCGSGRKYKKCCLRAG